LGLASLDTTNFAADEDIVEKCISLFRFELEPVLLSYSDDVSVVEQEFTRDVVFNAVLFRLLNTTIDSYKERVVSSIIVRTITLVYSKRFNV
jgi:hypothetical protein